ncbi:tetratricopeptide repeat protein [Citromicrobium bathyomarinum]|uniref:tetratricopeptide repeat protein n=1 Tax=Citromicrobium bathyomarinum TaxID=72174 RepID=UPI00315A0EF9
MPFFVPSSRKASKLALAAAIMGVGAFGLTAYDAPAYAKKDEKKKSSAQFSEAFQKAYPPVEEAMKDKSIAQEKILQMILDTESAVSTPDDQLVFGNGLYNTALDLKNYELAGKGMEMMLDSGKLPSENVAQYSFTAGQLAYNNHDYAKARQRLQEAADLGFDDPELSRLIAQSFVLEDNQEGGLTYLDGVIGGQIDAGTTPTDEMLELGFSLAYENGSYDKAADYALMRAEYYPSDTTWRNAIAVERNFGEFSDAEILDLMRLMHITGTMTEGNEYADYINAANYRRLPAEVLEIAEEAVAKGLLDQNDTLVAEAMNEGRERSPGLRADMAELASDAKAGGASGSLAIAAGDVYLNFGEPADAAELYEVALTRPDVDRNTALTRLGIAQVETGDFAAAQETFAKVQGNRESIAKLWAAYAAQEASAGMDS